MLATHPAMRIEPATLVDAHAVAAIHVDAWRVAYASILSAEYLAALSVEERATQWRRCISAGEPELLVARDVGSVLGWICFGASSDEGAPSSEAELLALYAAPSAWSTGVGRALWLAAKHRLRDRGFAACSLWVFPQNDRAIRFYRAAGFTADPGPPKDCELGGRPLQEVRYVRPLDR
jgi:ribosomal protein S18 acetylase RimI-like enzyme